MRKLWNFLLRAFLSFILPPQALDLLLDLRKFVHCFALGEYDLGSLIESVLDDGNDLFEGVRFGAVGSFEPGNDEFRLLPLVPESGSRQGSACLHRKYDYKGIEAMLMIEFGVSFNCKKNEPIKSIYVLQDLQLRLHRVVELVIPSFLCYCSQPICQVLCPHYCFVVWELALSFQYLLKLFLQRICPLFVPLLKIIFVHFVSVNLCTRSHLHLNH